MITFKTKDDTAVLVRSTDDIDAREFCARLGISKSARKDLQLPERLKKNQWNTIGIQNAEQPGYCAEPAEIVYEDETCLAAYKPPGILVHGDGSGAPTLEERVNAHLCTSGFPFRARACHRLDVETCGLVLFCKIPFLQNFYDEQFRSQSVFKEYYLLVDGTAGWKTKTVDAPIGRDRHNAKKMIVFPRGKEARTIFTNLSCESGRTLLKARLIHGRRHQIRVHSAWSGFPIVNDPLYSEAEKTGPLALECFHLGFVSAQEQKKTDVQIGLTL